MNKNKNRYEFFEYNGKCYGIGTVVKFKPDTVRSLHGETELYGRYYYGRSYNGYHAFNVGESSTVFDDKRTRSVSGNEDVSDIIEEIIIPVEVPYVSFTEKKYAINDWENGELIIWWVIYIIVMLISSIFVFRIFLWTVASFIFWGCRHEKLKEYGYK